MEVLQAAQPTVEAWVELAWVEPAADPFGYDYSRWVDSLASLDADRGLLASDPPAVGFVEFNTNLNADGELRDKLTADMRSVLWLMSATGDGGDWRSPASDPEFAVVAASDATVEAAADAVSEQDLVAAPPVSLSGLGDPVVERDGSDRVVRVLWPVVIDVVVSHTDPDLGPGLARLRAGTTLELVEFGGSSTFLVRSAAAAGEFLYFLKSPVLDPAG
ncbi:MAG: hypothetical protein OXQ29_28390 [Rhodospirillaceae bacterium]|nr:hypothetical protein [Rhodospirillaceae bacterium]